MSTIALGLVPFILILIFYCVIAERRHASNPNDRLVPDAAQFWDALRWANSGGPTEAPIVVDTMASITRLTIGLTISGGCAYVLALGIHGYRMVHDLCKPMLVTIAKIPPVALMPLLLLWVGVNETSKIGLLVIGLVPGICLQLLATLTETKGKLKAKTRSLQLSKWQESLFVDLPVTFPSFVRQLQVSLGPAWLFLLVSETIGAENGLGYRIFVVRRHLAMDIILLYVVWITVISIALYALLCRMRGLVSWIDDEN